MSPITSSSSNYQFSSARSVRNALTGRGFYVTNCTGRGRTIAYQCGDVDHEVIMYEREDNLFSSEETCKQITTNQMTLRLQQRDAVMTAFLAENEGFIVPTGTHTTWLAQHNAQA